MYIRAVPDYQETVLSDEHATLPFREFTVLPKPDTSENYCTSCGVFAACRFTAFPAI